MNSVNKRNIEDINCSLRRRGDFLKINEEEEESKCSKAGKITGVRKLEIEIRKMQLTGVFIAGNGGCLLCMEK